METYGGFLKWWVSPTTMGFPTKNDHFGVFWGYHHLRKHPYLVIPNVAIQFSNYDSRLSSIFWKIAETATHSGGTSRDNESSTRKILDLGSKETQETTDSPSIFHGLMGIDGSGRWFKHAIHICILWFFERIGMKCECQQDRQTHKQTLAFAHNMISARSILCPCDSNGPHWQWHFCLMQMSTQQWDFISAEGRLCAKCLRSGDTGSTSAISVSRVRKEELSNKVAAVLLENARLQWFQFQPILPQLVLQNQKKELLTYCSPCCVCYIAALLGGRILRIRNIAEGRLCAKCLRSGGTGSTSAISVSRVRKEELSNKVAAVLLENARLQWFQFQPILVRFQAYSLLPQLVLQNQKKNYWPTALHVASVTLLHCLVEEF